MIRRLLTFASVLSLLLFVASLVLLFAPPWKTAVLRCGRYEVHVRVRPGGDPLGGGGSIGFWRPYVKEGDGDEPQPSGPPHIWVGDLPMEDHRLLGLPYRTGGWVTTTWLTPHRYTAKGMYFSTIYFHYRTAAATFAVLPAGWTIRHAKRLRPRRGNRNERECAVCGYDLRASKDRCPECGTLIALEAKA